MNSDILSRKKERLRQSWSGVEERFSIVMPLRLIFISAVLFIFYLSHSLLSSNVFLVAVLVLYTTYSIGSYFVFLRWALQLPNKVVAATDVSCAILLIALNHGADSVFFDFLIFAVLLTSFYGGRKLSLQTTVAAAVVYAIVSAATPPLNSNFELDNILLRCVYITVLGYLASCYGGGTFAYRDRLDLLRDVAKMSNPRLGLEHAIGQSLQRLCDLYDCNVCLLLASDVERTRYNLYRVYSNEKKMESTVAPPSITHKLLRIPDELAMIYSHPIRLYQISQPYSEINIRTGKRSSEAKENAHDIGEFFEATSWSSVPIHKDQDCLGRIFLTSNQHRAFTLSDVNFVIQVFESIVPIWAHIQLVEDLSTHASENEKRRIALDIHDSVIQPYIALQIGLQAIIENMESQAVSLNQQDQHELSAAYAGMLRLREMTTLGVAEMRSYVIGLKQDTYSDNSFLQSIERYANKISDATGMPVTVNGDSRVDIHGKLAGEAFQIVCEGLSNVHRHTNSQSADINLTQTKDLLVLSIRNEADTTREMNFTPRSINERAQALGGNVKVDFFNGLDTIVTVSIPL